MPRANGHDMRGDGANAVGKMARMAGVGRTRTWKRCIGERGTIAEQLLLNRTGFVAATDVNGDVSYVGRNGAIWLCPKNQWYADNAPEQCTSIEEYLSYIRQQPQR